MNATSFSTTPLQPVQPSPTAVGRQQPRPAGEQIGPRVLQAAFRRAGQRMTADEREPRRQRPRGAHDLALRAAGIGDDRRPADVFVELAQQRDVLLDRRREDDEVRLGEDDQVVGRDVDRVQAHRRLEHVLVVDAR